MVINHNLPHLPHIYHLLPSSTIIYHDSSITNQSAANASGAATLKFGATLNRHLDDQIPAINRYHPQI
jgi:hypothetical protein